MEEIGFLVQGSSEEPYRVVFTRRSPENLSALCTCGAGVNGQYCKHRFAILAGDVAAIISGNEGDVPVVQSWLAGTDVELAMRRLRDLELEAMRTKDAISAAKKELARSMRD